VHEELLTRRADYPVLARGTYLANHTLGAMHAGSRRRLTDFTDLWAERGVTAWETWATETQQAADLVGSLVGAQPGTTVMRASVADALASVASCLDPGSSRTRVVIGDVEWPGSLHLWRAHARWGVEPVVVAMGDDGVPPADVVAPHVERLVEAIDERTALVHLSAVQFRTGTWVDPTPVVERAHAVGALVVLDAYQAAGIVPLDVTALGVDIVLGGSVKYLGGGPGAGWLVLRAGLQLEPADVGWWGQARPFAFDPEPAYAAGVRRFSGGTPPVPSAYAAEPGYRALAEVGLQRIRERSVSLTQPLVEAVIEHGWTLRSPVDPTCRGGSVTFDPGDGERVTEQLIARGIIVDHRPGAGIRVGPHFFTTSDEVAACVEAVAELVT